MMSKLSNSNAIGGDESLEEIRNNKTTDWNVVVLLLPYSIYCKQYLWGSMLFGRYFDDVSCK